MRWLRSKWRIILGMVGALALIVVVGGFAMSRGYLMRFNMNETQISREAFYRAAYDLRNFGAYSVINPERAMHCTSEWALGWSTVYEIHCFDTPEAVNGYMETS
jgi:hypothetical protein